MNPGERTRLRVSKACERCRAQKIKCSGTYPCVTCAKHKRSCVYDNSTKLSKEEDVLSNIPTMLNVKSEKELPYIVRNEDRNYTKHLENRIQYLESRLSEDSGEKIIHNIRNGETEDELTEYYSQGSKWRQSNRDHLFLLNELCKCGYESLNEENKRKVQLPRHQYFGWNLSGTHYLSPEPLPNLPKVELTEPLEFYISYFMKEINPLFAIIHEPVFMLQYSSYKEIKAKQELTDNNIKLFEAMLYLIVTISIRFVEFSKKKNVNLKNLEIEEQLFKFSHRIVQILSFEWTSFELIQCWVIITLYLRVTHRQNSHFQALGYAITMCKSMGLGKNLGQGVLHGTNYEAIKIKRIFFLVLTLERLFGLQIGRFSGLGHEDTKIEFPSRDFEVERAKDTWITLPALAMIHFAKLSSVVHYSVHNKLDLIQYQHINKEIISLNNWLNENGFNNNEIFNSPDESISSLVKAQVKLHYYDLILYVHGKIMFNFVGRRFATQGLKIELVLDSCVDIIDIFTKVNRAGLLFTPWYLNLLLLVHVGVNLLILINSGLFLPVSREYYAKTVELITVLKKANVKSLNNKTLIKSRFKMAEECLWALKTAGHIITLRMKQDMKALTDVGIDAGSSDVNRTTFTHFGLANSNDPTERKDFLNLIRTGKKRKFEDSEDPINDRTDTTIGGEEVSDATELHKQQDGESLDGSVSTSVEMERIEKEFNVGKIYSNLTWFDQWLNVDFGSAPFMQAYDTAPVSGNDSTPGLADFSNLNTPNFHNGDPNGDGGVAGPAAQQFDKDGNTKPDYYM